MKELTLIVFAAQISFMSIPAIFIQYLQIVIRHLIYEDTFFWPFYEEDPKDISTDS